MDKGILVRIASDLQWEREVREDQGTDEATISPLTRIMRRAEEGTGKMSVEEEEEEEH